MAETFATLIAEVRVDDANLKADLRKDEKVIRDSAAKMQASLARVSVGAGSVGRAGFDASRGLSALSSSAGALGGSLGGLVGQASATITSVQALSLSMGGLSAAMLGGAGAVIALVAFREELIEATTWALKFLDANRNIEESALRTAAALTKEAQFFKQQADLLRAVQVQEGLLSKEEARRLQLKGQFGGVSDDQINATMILEAKRASNIVDQQATKAEEMAAKATQARISALQQEHDILTGKLTLAETIKDLDERALFVGNKKIKDAEALFQIDKRRILGDLARFREEERVQRATNRGVAQSLAIQAGINQPSDFVSDPTQRRLMQLMERLSSAEQPGGFGGSIGQKVVSNVANITARPFGEQRVSTEKQQEKQTGLLSEIKRALDGLSFGAAP